MGPEMENMTTERLTFRNRWYAIWHRADMLCAAVSLYLVLGRHGRDGLDVLVVARSGRAQALCGASEEAMHRCWTLARDPAAELPRQASASELLTLLLQETLVGPVRGLGDFLKDMGYADPDGMRAKFEAANRISIALDSIAHVRAGESCGLCLRRCKSEASLRIIANFEGSDFEGRSIAELQLFAAAPEEGEIHGLDGPRADRLASPLDHLSQFASSARREKYAPHEQ